MRHQSRTKQLKRTEEERKRLKITLAKALIKNRQIITFKVRGKWFRSFFERLITLCKRAGENEQLAFRRARQYLDEETARTFVEKIVPKMKDRNGGYTRVLNYQKPNSVHKKVVISIVD